MTSQDRALSNWIDSYMEYTEDSEPPKMFHLWTAISTIASAMQRKCYLNWGTLTFYPNMYIVLVAPSGKCRKGTAMDPARELLNTLALPLAAEATTREALIRALREANATNFDPNSGDQHFHSSLTIHSKELTVFLGYDNKQLMMDLTDWFDCHNRWTYRTKTQGDDDIIGIWVNLIGATTPDLIQTALPPDAIGGGLTSRIIFVYESRKYKTVIYPKPGDEELYKGIVSDLERIHLMAGQFKVTDEFIDVWSHWYPEQELNPPQLGSNLSGYLERRPTHVMKLSMILSAARSSELVITKEDIEKAIRILHATERRMPQVFSGVGKSQIISILPRIMSYIAELKTVTKPKLMERFLSDIDDFMLDRVLKTLQTMKYIKIIENVGKPTEIQYTGEEAKTILGGKNNDECGGDFKPTNESREDNTERSERA